MVGNHCSYHAIGGSCEEGGTATLALVAVEQVRTDWTLSLGSYEMVLTFKLPYLTLATNFKITQSNTNHAKPMQNMI